MKTNGLTGMSSNMFENCKMKDMNGSREAKQIDAEKIKSNELTSNKTMANNTNGVKGNLIDLKV